MGFLRRSRPESGVPDEAFPFLTQEQATRLRNLVRTTFAEAGTEVTVHADHVVDAEGQTFGLANLAAACHANDRRERTWPKLVRQHVRGIVAAVEAPSPFDALSPEQVLAATYLRIMDVADVQPWMSGHTPEIAPGLHEVLALDTPEVVHFFGEDELDRFGPLEELREAGLRNLRSVPIDEHEVLARDGGTVQVLNGESMFIASLLLILPEVVSRFDAPIDPELGAFVALPHRHQLDVHVLRDATALPSLQVLTSWALAGFDGAPGAVNPDVYWWRPGEYQRLTTVGPDGIRVDVGPELDAVLERLER